MRETARVSATTFGRVYPRKLLCSWSDMITSPRAVRRFVEGTSYWIEGISDATIAGMLKPADLTDSRATARTGQGMDPPFTMAEHGAVLCRYRDGAWKPTMIHFVGDAGPDHFMLVDARDLVVRPDASWRAYRIIEESNRALGWHERPNAAA